MLQHRQHLDRLAQPHVVGQTPAEPKVTQERQPTDAQPLVVPQFAAEVLRCINRSDAAEVPQVPAQRPERLVDVRRRQFVQHRVEQKRPGPVDPHPPRTFSFIVIDGDLPQFPQRRVPTQPFLRQHPDGAVVQHDRRLAPPRGGQQRRQPHGDVAEIDAALDVEPIDARRDAQFEFPAAADLPPPRGHLPPGVAQPRHRLDQPVGRQPRRHAGEQIVRQGVDPRPLGRHVPPDHRPVLVGPPPRRRTRLQLDRRIPHHERRRQRLGVRRRLRILRSEVTHRRRRLGPLDDLQPLVVLDRHAAERLAKLAVQRRQTATRYVDRTAAVPSPHGGQLIDVDADESPTGVVIPHRRDAVFQPVRILDTSVPQLDQRRFIRLALIRFSRRRQPDRRLPVVASQFRRHPQRLFAAAGRRHTQVQPVDTVVVTFEDRRRAELRPRVVFVDTPPRIDQRPQRLVDQPRCQRIILVRGVVVIPGRRLGHPPQDDDRIGFADRPKTVTAGDRRFAPIAVAFGIGRIQPDAHRMPPPVDGNLRPPVAPPGPDGEPGLGRRRWSVIPGPLFGRRVALPNVIGDPPQRTFPIRRSGFLLGGFHRSRRFGRRRSAGRLRDSLPPSRPAFDHRRPRRPTLGRRVWMPDIHHRRIDVHQRRRPPNPMRRCVLLIQHQQRREQVFAEPDVVVPRTLTMHTDQGFIGLRKIERDDIRFRLRPPNQPQHPAGPDGGDLHVIDQPPTPLSVAIIELRRQRLEQLHITPRRQHQRHSTSRPNWTNVARPGPDCPRRHACGTSRQDLRGEPLVPRGEVRTRPMAGVLGDLDVMYRRRPGLLTPRRPRRLLPVQPTEPTPPLPRGFRRHHIMDA